MQSPWVTPEEIKRYTDFKDVQARSDEKLLTDISRAESYVVSYTRNSFGDFDKIPEPVKTAVLILAEAYAHNAWEQAREGRYKSESFKEYSYTLENGTVDLSGLELGPLLDGFIIHKPKNAVSMRLTKL